MLKNKKGMEQLYMYILYLVIILIVLFSMVYYVNDVSKGKAMEKQLTAKKLALILDVAQPGTKINLNSENTEIEKKEKKIYIHNKGEKQGYEYFIYNPYNIKIIKEEKKTRIEVEDV